MYLKVLTVVALIGVLAVRGARGDEPAGGHSPLRFDPPAKGRADADPAPRAKIGGTDNDPLIQLELTPAVSRNTAETVLACLNQLPWASRTAVLPRYPGIIPKGLLHPRAVAVVAVGERQWADISDLVQRLGASGHTVSAMHLTHFGTLRIHVRFGPLPGDTVEVTEGKQKRTIHAPTSVARRSIEAAFQQAPWFGTVRYAGAGTKPDFKLDKDKPEVRAEFTLAPDQAIDLSTLLDTLKETGFPPKTVRIARMGAGVPFGFALPGDVELVDAAGKPRRSGQLHQLNRPTVLVFFSLKGKYKKAGKEQSYQAQPLHFARLKEVVETYQKRVDFIAISSRPDDPFREVTALWEKAGMPFPVLRDAGQKLATALSVGMAQPPPHIFIVDAAGKLRYAGDFADGWVEPEKIKRIYLVEAIERVLAQKYAENGAVFYNSAPCDCSEPACKCPKCGCHGPCRCGCSTGGG
jgi:hypothetical protein